MIKKKLNTMCIKTINIIAKLLKITWINYSNRKITKILINKISRNKFFVREYMLIHTLTFKKYITNKTYIKRLLSGLDKKSQDIANKIIDRIQKINNYKALLIPKTHLLSKKEINDKDMEYYKRSFQEKTQKKFKLNYHEIWFDRKIFEYKYWLDEISWKNKWIRFLKYRDILDCWACHWDTALLFMLSTNFRNIYAFEPNTSNYKILQRVINTNNLWDKIIPIKKWLWESFSQMYITNNSWASYINKKIWEKIDIITIDKFVNENNAKPWLIKWDIEWYELESVRWAERTIKKFKPILLISIYHTWKDFFEIKPLIEKWNLWYKFKIRKNSDHPFAETILICYHNNDENIAHIPNLPKT